MVAVRSSPGNLEGTPTLNAAVLTADILGWPILQLSISRASLYLPERYFAPNSSYSGFESREIKLYRQTFCIRKWKHLLPDGSGWIGGAFSKQHLLSHKSNYLLRFALEARRGELAHWCMLLCFPIFYLWNPPWASVIMTIYALAANLPCIIVQRYNRIVILRDLCSQKN